MFLSCKSYCFFIRNIILSQSFDVEGCAGSCSHNCHGVLYLDNHGQELPQLPVWWKPHTWWGFVVLFVKCKFFLWQQLPGLLSSASLPSPQPACPFLGGEGSLGPILRGAVGAARPTHCSAQEENRVYCHQPDCWPSPSTSTEQEDD